MDIRWLGEEDCQDPAVVGPKAANCSRLKKFNVPPGFCLPAIEVQAQRVGPEEIQLSKDLKEAIAKSYRELGKILRVENPPVAVRSSAVDEDGHNVSFAGQHATFLNIVGEDMLFDAIVKCWESAEHEVVLEYRKKHELNLDHVHIAVLVQSCIPSDVAGIAFSANPITKNRGEIVIESSIGLGISLADGIVNPDHFVVDKKNIADIKSKIQKKSVMIVYEEKGTKEMQVPVFFQKQPSLTSGQITKVAQLMVDLEKHEGRPIDIEFAIYQDNLYLLQCRPITTL